MVVTFLLILFSIILLDIIWFSFSFKMYNKQIEDVQKSKSSINLYYAFITYILITLGLLFIINITKASSTKTKDLIINCGIFGLLTYGIYDFTSLAIYKDYSLGVGIVDTIWGGVVCMIIAMLYSFYSD